MTRAKSILKMKRSGGVLTVAAGYGIIATASAKATLQCNAQGNKTITHRHLTVLQGMVQPQLVSVDQKKEQDNGLWRLGKRVVLERTVLCIILVAKM